MIRMMRKPFRRMHQNLAWYAAWCKMNQLLLACVIWQTLRSTTFREKLQTRIWLLHILVYWRNGCRYFKQSITEWQTQLIFQSYGFEILNLLWRSCSSADIGNWYALNYLSYFLYKIKRCLFEFSIQTVLFLF